MDFQAKAAIAFIIILAIVLYVKRNKLHKQSLIPNVIYILMYRTKVGLNFMDRTAKKYPRLLRVLGSIGIFISFLGMTGICVLLLKGTYDLLFVKGAIPSVGIVQPFSENIPGTFFVPFFYLIIAIFVLVIVHEFSHGIMARLYNLKIKSSGLAFFAILLPIIPAAFVEPDEKKLKTKPRKEQLSILAAGPFSNIVFAFIVFGFVALIAVPFVDAIIDYDGVLVSDLIKEEGKQFPGEIAGIGSGEIITSIDDREVVTITNLTYYLHNKSPGDIINIKTNVTTYDLTLGENPENSSQPYMGLYLKQHTKVKPGFNEKYGRFTAPAIMWLIGLMIWVYALNLGIGLFNLLPIPITDGGRMFHLALDKFFTKQRSFQIWKFVAILFIALIFINIGAGFIR